jgi:hypothetical protein
MNERNNWTGEHSVHGQTRPSNWELRLADELTARKPGE